MIRKAHTLLLFLAVSPLIGCSSGEAPNPDVAQEIGETAAEIVYSKDERSGLCFGSVTTVIRGKTGKIWFKAVSITNVPCDKVERLLVK